MLTENLTSFQVMSQREREEWLTRVSSICIASERSFNVFNYWLKQEEEHCDKNHIRVAKIIDFSLPTKLT